MLSMENFTEFLPSIPPCVKTFINSTYFHIMKYRTYKFNLTTQFNHFNIVQSFDIADIDIFVLLKVLDVLECSL